MPDALKVLILEDSPEDAAHIVEQLRTDGFEPQWTRVETRDEYVARLDEAWDLVIADFMLPGFDGLAALRLLRERGLETPYIIVTGVLDDLVAAECLQQGANDFLLKDRLRRLGAAVRNALEQGRLREEGRRAAAIAVESEAKRLAYLVAVPDLMVRVRSDGALLDYWASEDSPAVLPLDRIPGSRVDEVLPSNIARDFMRCAKASLETGKRQAFEFELQRPEGLRHFEARLGHSTKNEAIATIRDVTDRYRARQEVARLAEENAILASIGRTVTSSLDFDEVLAQVAEQTRGLISFDVLAINLLEPDGATLRMAYTAGVEAKFDWRRGRTIPLAGTVSENVLQEGRGIAFHPKERADMADRYPRSLQAFTAGYRSFLVVPLTGRDEARGTLVFLSKQKAAFGGRDLEVAGRIGNKISGVLANSRLYEERRRAEERLRESEERYRALVENLDARVSLKGADGRYMLANQRFMDYVGRPDGVAGMTVRDLSFSPATSDALASRDAEVFRSGKTLRFEETLPSEHGPQTFLVRKAPVRDSDGQVSAVVTVSTDITEMHESQAQARRLARESELLAEIGRTVSSAPGVGDVFERFSELLGELVPLDGVGVIVVEPADGRVVLTNLHTEGGRLPWEQGVAYEVEGTFSQAVAREGRPLRFSTASRSTLKRRYPGSLPSFEAGYRSFAGAPLLTKGEAFGALTLISQELDAYDDAHLMLLERVAAQISGPIANARLYEERVRTETELAALFEAVAHPIVVSDRTGTIVRVNSEATAAFGYREEELLGSPVEVLLPERYRSRHPQRVADWFSNPTRRPMGTGRVLRAIRKDGAEFPIDLSLSPVAIGDETWCIAVVQDVTLAVEAQDALRRSEETHRRLSEENAAIAEIGRIVGSSLAMDEVYDGFGELACSLLPAERVDVVAVDLERGTLRVEYSHGDAIDAPTAQVGFERPLAGSIAEAVIARGSPVLVVPSSRDELSETFPAAAGSYDLGIRSAIFVPLASGGKPIGMITFASTEPGAFSEQELSLADRIGGHLSGALANTQLYAQGEAARREMARLAQAVESTHDAVFITDIGGRINYVDSAASALTGYGHSELIGSHLVDMMPESDARLYDEIADSVKISGEWRGETTLQSRSGETLDVRISAAPVKDEQGRPSGMVATATDIRAEKRSEAALREVSRLASVGELAAGVAHELNNPLASIVGFAELLSAGDMDEQVRRDIGKIQSNAQRASRIVQDLLYFARRHEPARAPVDIVQIVRRAVELKRYDFERAGISVSVDSSRGLPEVQGDEHQLIQVVLNLLTNAAQAIGEVSPEGRVDITVAHESERIRITVADNGPGIPSEIRGRLFDPFFTTKEVGKGTGLGLSLSLGIVLQHGGRLWVESETGAGATFHVDLPTTDGAAVSAVEPAVADGVQPERARGPDATAARGMDVLVVDDESDVREMVRRHLLSTGIRVDSADGGNQAWMLLKEKTYDAIVTDLLMPEMDGRELYERIEKTDKAIARRVVFMTGDTLSPDTRRFLKNTGCQALGKPFTREDLLRAVREIQEQQHDKP